MDYTQTNGYCVCATSEVETLLYHFLRSNFGAETGENQGKKYWNVSDFGNVAKVIRRFDKS